MITSFDIIFSAFLLTGAVGAASYAICSEIERLSVKVVAAVRESKEKSK